MISFGIVFIIIVNLIYGQFNLYYTDLINKNSLYHDCLQYNSVNYVKVLGIDSRFPNPYQIIPYCLRPFSEEEWVDTVIVHDNIVSNLTFDELKTMNVTGRDLLSWSASIDLVERYENYLNDLEIDSKFDRFYNCTPLWFGTFCQFTFDSDQLFDDIVEETFEKKDVEYIGTSPDIQSHLDITNLTCYLHIQCNRGPSPMCLDWREICDGRIDCLGDGIDEMNCLQLEINECESNEYRCHNGMCIPEDFVNDHAYNTDCLDRTDENNFDELKIGRSFGFTFCYQDPTFRCEESDHFFGLRGFVCGDGQNIKMQTAFAMNFDATSYLYCKNRRNEIMWKSTLSNIQHSWN
ncbi:unnamed protein product [Adineta ricciae]|uniref:Uncharacterized protein n=1 Tax=Adineta ricciae TaxID=249248 RepID=A0A815X8P8_ADIRI|nr:unnamed protein product [Adineta ricciae]CAF1554347.1 unnamed protein product [Adineta ricciae]